MTVVIKYTALKYKAGVGHFGIIKTSKIICKPVPREAYLLYIVFPQYLLIGCFLAYLYWGRAVIGVYSLAAVQSETHPLFPHWFKLLLLRGFEGANRRKGGLSVGGEEFKKVGSRTTRVILEQQV